MAHDIVIRGGMTVDGRGGEPVAADVAIDNGLISIVGKVTEKGQQEINARGMTVTPGFIDMHTHLDAQVLLGSRVITGIQPCVTTAMMGNCGVGFAPCSLKIGHCSPGCWRLWKIFQENRSLRGSPGTGWITVVIWTLLNALAQA